MVHADIALFHLCPNPFYKLQNFLRSPDCCAWAKLYRLWETACFAALPPGAFADGDELQDLGEPKEAHLWDGCHSSHYYTS
jgi:hypothetical protein